MKDVDKSSQGLKADDLGLDDMCSVWCVHKYNINMNTKETYMADTIANTHGTWTENVHWLSVNCIYSTNLTF